MLEQPWLMETCGLRRERNGRKGEHEEPSVPGATLPPQLFCAVTKVKSYQWNLEIKSQFISSSQGVGLLDARTKSEICRPVLTVICDR